MVRLLKFLLDPMGSSYDKNGNELKGVEEY